MGLQRVRHDWATFIFFLLLREWLYSGTRLDVLSLFLMSCLYIKIFSTQALFWWSGFWWEQFTQCKKKRTLNAYWRKRKKFKCTNIGRFSIQEFVALSNKIHLALKVTVMKFSHTFPTVYSIYYFWASVFAQYCVKFFIFMSLFWERHYLHFT